jgi:hypothetical protein
MRASLVRGGVVGACTIAAVTMLPFTAFAAGGSAHCTAKTCHVGIADFPGGTLAVDVDVSGSGTGVFAVTGPSNYHCSGSFPASGGVRSYLCSGAPAGTYAAGVTGPAGPSAVGLRW